MYLAHKQRRNQIELPSTVHPPAHYSEPKRPLSLVIKVLVSGVLLSPVN